MSADDERGRNFARALLIGRLVAQHGLGSAEALDAVLAAERHEPGPHTELVRTEASAIAAAVFAPIAHQLRRTLEAMVPAFQAAAKALAQAVAVTRDAYALAPPPSGRLNGAQVHVLIDDEWQPVPGITGVEISGGWADDPTPSETANPPEPPVPRRPSRAARRGNRSRPAWQTPYGPAPRHH